MKGDEEGVKGRRDGGKEGGRGDQEMFQRAAFKNECLEKEVYYL